MSFQSMNQSAGEVSDDYNGTYFKGKVIDNNDPLNLDRIKATVPGLYDSDGGDLPWIGPIKYAPFGQGEGWGSHGAPAIGSDIIVLLQQGDQHHPVYHSLKAVADEEFPSGETWGYRDPFGNRFICKTAGEVEFKSNSGVVINISANGDLAITTPGSLSASVAGDMNLAVAGSTTMSASATTVNGPVEFTDSVTVAGATALNGGLGVEGGGSINGALLNNGVNISNSHRHDTHHGPTGLPY